MTTLKINQDVNFPQTEFKNFAELKKMVLDFSKKFEIKKNTSKNILKTSLKSKKICKKEKKDPTIYLQSLLDDPENISSKSMPIDDFIEQMKKW